MQGKELHDSTLRIKQLACLKSDLETLIRSSGSDTFNRGLRANVLPYLPKHQKSRTGDPLKFDSLATPEVSGKINNYMAMQSTLYCLLRKSVIGKGTLAARGYTESELQEDFSKVFALAYSTADSAQ